MSIRWKVILPYLLLTLVVAVTGVYVVTKLVTNSLSERLTNQLLEAGRVVSDSVARQEIKHLDVGRILAYTRGMAEALLANDLATVKILTKPIAGGLDAENIIIVNMDGKELVNIIKNEDGSLSDIQVQSGAGGLPIVKTLLDEKDPDALPRRMLALNPTDQRHYYYTANSIVFGAEVVGVVLIGTSLDTILPYLKSVSLADIILYGDKGQAIATTLGGKNSDLAFLQSLSIPEATFNTILSQTNVVSGQTLNVDGHSYSLARSSLQVSNDHVGAFAVVLPLNFVVQSGSVSRNSYVVLFALVMLGVVMIGYAISRLIINPLNALVRTSQAIAGGDLTQRTNIDSRDEIGQLADSFDEMTGHLQERTEELQRTYNILEQMDRTKTTFIEVAGHELRTPITLVKGYTQMLQSKASTDAELAIMANGIMDGTNRMSDIINSMLDVSKIDNKTLKVLSEKVQVGLVLMRVQKTFKQALEERRLNFEVRNLDSLPMIEADPDLLYKAFYHLVMNAIKYTPDGGRISINGQEIHNNGSKPEIEVVITDNGIGIDQQHHKLVFEKFYQTGEVHLHSSGKTKFKGGGPGLGLSIVRGVIEAHGGRVWVESTGHNEEAYPGSKFFVRLPTQKAGAQE